jgi:hypothetical protein
MDRRADVVHLLDAVDGPGQHGRLADVADYYLLDAQAAQHPAAADPDAADVPGS